MIHFLTEEHVEDFLAAAQMEPISGARVQTLYSMYGLNYKSASFWVQKNRLDQPTAALCLFGGQLTVSGGIQADLDEVEEFVRFMEGISAVSGPPMLCGMLQNLGRPQYFQSMVHNGIPFADDFPDVNGAPAFSDIYDLLCYVDKEFDDSTNRGAWHVHVSHLIRHKLGYCAGVYQKGELVSTGGVYNSGTTHGVIGGLATISEYKGQGYAGQICRYLSNCIIKAKKTPALYAATESLIVYYEAMGFSTSGQWAEITLRPSFDNNSKIGFVI